MSNRIFENKTTTADKTSVTCRVDLSSDEARRYGKTPAPGERNNPEMAVRNIRNNE